VFNHIECTTFGITRQQVGTAVDNLIPNVIIDSLGGLKYSVLQLLPVLLYDLKINQTLMGKKVNIEVYCEIEDGEKSVFGVTSEHRPDFPKPFDKPLQNWVRTNFDDLEVGAELLEAGEMIYNPNGEIIEFQKKDT